MSKQILDILLGSRVRVQLLKFLFRNFPEAFDARTLSRRIRIPLPALAKEIKRLSELGLIRRTRVRTHTLDPDFELFAELKDLMIKPSSSEKQKLAERIAGIGRVALAVISGVFLDPRGSVAAEHAATDLFIVADGVSRRKLMRCLRAIEADVGVEIRFSLMEKKEFNYRYGMFDRFVRVLLENPHEKIINKLGKLKA